MENSTKIIKIERAKNLVINSSKHRFIYNQRMNGHV